MPGLRSGAKKKHPSLLQLSAWVSCQPSSRYLPWNMRSPNLATHESVLGIAYVLPCGFLFSFPAISALLLAGSLLPPWITGNSFQGLRGGSLGLLRALALRHVCFFLFFLRVPAAGLRWTEVPLSSPSALRRAPSLQGLPCRAARFAPAADAHGSCAGLWDQGVLPHFCDTRESPLYMGGVVFGKPFLLYHRSGFHFPQPCCEFASSLTKTPVDRGPTSWAGA